MGLLLPTMVIYALERRVRASFLKNVFLSGKCKGSKELVKQAPAGRLPAAAAAVPEPLSTAAEVCELSCAAAVVSELGGWEASSSDSGSGSGSSSCCCAAECREECGRGRL
jgi:hypothetical protein